jgi:hypothetical protein
MDNDLKASILLGEARAFITNTNNLYSVNNGPFPNTALQYSTALLAIYASNKKKKEESNIDCLLNQ